MSGQNLGANPTIQEGIQIDFKRILFRSLKFWYLIVLSLTVAFVIAFFSNRYATRIYPVTASILIKESQESSEGRLLYNNPLVSGFRNYQNEIFLIRSYPFIERTLEQLNFGVAFYNEGNVLTTEAYEIEIEGRVVNDNGIFNKQFHIKKLDTLRYELMPNGGEINSQTIAKKQIFNFGDTVFFEGLRVVFDSRHNPDTDGKIGINYLFRYISPSILAGNYVGRLRASWAEQGSGVINLSIDGANPYKEIDFLNGLITEYQQYDLEKKNLAASRTIDFISEQLKIISDSLHDVEGKLQRFKDTNLMTDLSTEAERLYSKLQPLEEQRGELMIRKSYYKYLTDYLQNSNNYDQAILPSSVGIADEILSAQIGAMIDLQFQIKRNVKADNPLVIEAKHKVGEIKSEILELVRNQKATDKIKQDFLDKQIHDLEKQLQSLPLAERRLVSIQRSYTLLESIYLFLLQKKAEAGISKASTTSDISLVNPPMLAGTAISPKPAMNYFMAFIIGLGLPILLFILQEILNTKIQSKEDVEKVTRMPFIGGVGHKQGENNLEVLTSPKSAIAESFRALRSNLSYFLGTQERAVFMITSSISGEGKTFTSVNLASVFALSGKKTLIVGADMRRPKIYQDFGLTNDVGLSSFLAGILSFDQIVQHSSNTYLDVVSGGPVPPNPSELLLTAKMEGFLTEAKSRYDYIIIDTPPLAIVTDAFVLAKFSDHTLFLVRQNYTPKSLIRTVNDYYVSGKLKNISIVLNDIYKTGPGYGYGYGYSYGYSYGYGYGSRKKQKNGYGYYSE